ncbi:unnamed protein product [Arabidopsis thaliana]|uniref:VAN3-binding protein-like auxin canalisation domain-containing protein n=1 Tax=Arabidopsis thaliana TaxID=3702 RepID=Q9FHG6_ARATH|nr:unnamed protein product [Arabidopsis thaliana]
MELSLALTSTDHNPSPSEAHPDTMDFLSREWCNFAVQSLHPDPILYDRSIVPVETSIAKFQGDSSPVSCAMMDTSMKMDDPDFKPSMPSWKTNDVKSWIWMQQAMHPELSYEGFFRKKLVKPFWPFRLVLIYQINNIGFLNQNNNGFVETSMENYAVDKEMVERDKGETKGRKNAGKDGGNGRPSTRETAVASAAAVVAAQCAQMAETMGANRDQLSTMIGSAMTGTSVSEILTLTASATTSLRGAATLKARRGCKINRLNGSAPVLPIEDSSYLPPEFDKNTSVLAKGTDLFVETPDERLKRSLD